MLESDGLELCLKMVSTRRRSKICSQNDHSKTWHPHQSLQVSSPLKTLSVRFWRTSFPLPCLLRDSIVHFGGTFFQFLVYYNACYMYPTLLCSSGLNSKCPDPSFRISSNQFYVQGKELWTAVLLDPLPDIICCCWVKSTATWIEQRLLYVPNASVF